jgi:predicted metal-binding membrane protein
MNPMQAAQDTPRGAFGVLSWRINVAVVAVLIALSALAWRSTIEQAHEMRHMAMGLGQIGVLMPGVMSPRYLLAMWAAMMAAMMLPAVAPMALAHLAVAKRRGDGALPTVAFVASYLAVWSTVGVVPVLAYLGFARIGEDAAQSRWLPSLAAIVLIVAGAYQFTGWKSVCLDKCRSPFAFIMTHDFAGGIASAARAGVAHGAYCVGCCAALFSVLLVVGLMNLFWMTALFLLVLAERSWKHGLVVAQVAGVVLVQAGIVVILQPAVLFFLASI